jgi:hypothetical protein
MLVILSSAPAPAMASGDRANEVNVCRLRSTALVDLDVSPELIAVAAQYFHSDHRGGYDAFRSRDDIPYRPAAETDFPWFDVADLLHPVIPPTGWRIVLPVGSGYFVTHRLSEYPRYAEELGLWRPGGGEPRWLGPSLYPVSAVQSHSGEIWAIIRGAPESAEADPPMHLLHVGLDGAIATRRFDVPAWGHDTTLVLTADDRPALVFLRRSAHGVGLLLSWNLDPSTARVVDEVAAPASVARRTQQTGVSLAAAREGPRGLAIAWRPLTDKHPTRRGDVQAEVRWLTVDPQGAIDGPHRFGTKARPLFVIGGPDEGSWPLQDNGLQVGELDGHAFFAWNEQAGVLGVRSIDTVPSPIAPPAKRDPGIQLRSRNDGLELLLLHSAPSARAFRIHCADR